MQSRGKGVQPNAVTISDSDVIAISNNDVILRSEGGEGVTKDLKIAVILKESPQIKNGFSRKENHL